MNISFKEKFRLGEKIKIQRLNDKKSLRKLASECEMSYATLYDIENGNGFPTEKVLISLVKNLNFKDKTEIYNLYAEIKESAPPDIIDFLVKNKDVSCIFSVAGGDYLMEMLEYVDFESIKNNPKWFQGFSDNTTLIYPIVTK